ncbi:MAG TPA: DMT family transporter [Thermodesulfobacteriota bacterium]|nr:DMT family transporter [Thermodesulfobacteriota bacterium]
MKSKTKKLPITGYLFLLSTAFFTAISYVCGKAVNKDLGPDVVTFYWFFGAFLFSLFVLPLFKAQRNEFKNIGKYKMIFLLSSIVTSIGAALWIFSLRSIGLPLTSFLMKAQTLFTLFLGIIFLKEKLNKGETIGIIITIIGGVIVAYQREGYLILGTATALTAAFFYSVLSFAVKKYASDLNMLTVANLRTMGVSIVVFIYLLILGKFELPSGIDFIYMALGGLTGAYIAKASQFQSIKLLGIARSTAVMPLESIFVIIFSYTIFNELPSAIKLAGGFIIVFGVYFLVIYRGGEQKN